MIPPRATMRLQLHKRFTFDDAARIAPYMARLGISHLYTSPILTARAGSMHGYDVTDPTRINPELVAKPGSAVWLPRCGRGSRADCRYRSEPHGCGKCQSLVAGRAAPRAGQPPRWGVRHRLAPGQSAAGRQGFAAGARPSVWRSIGAGEITLAKGPDGWEVHYFDNVLPVAPGDHAEIEHLSPAAYNPANEEGRARLHRLLQRQHYRLAWWRTAGDEINWRRFFDINELAGVRVEDTEVFEQTHALLFSLYAEGLIDGMSHNNT